MNCTKLLAFASISFASLAFVCGCPQETATKLPPAGIAGQGAAPASAPDAQLKPMAKVPDFSKPGAASAPASAPNAALPGVVVKSAGSQPTDATGAPIGDAVANAAAVAGKVIEAMHVKEYTYVQVQTKEGPVWAAVGKDETITKGKNISLAKDLWMTNFQSKSLNRTFDKILFGRVVGMN